MTSWSLEDVFATKNGLPYCMHLASHEIRGVEGLERSELLILTGLMIGRMHRKAYREHEVFPVRPLPAYEKASSTDIPQLMMLSSYGTNGRIVQAHMAPDSQRLQAWYSEFFEYRDLPQEWLDIFVRWFLNEPLATASAQTQPDREALEKHYAL
jgi:hypothetical protein